MRLFAIMWTLAFTVLAGSAIVAVLTAGRIDLYSILAAAGVGAALAVPVAWIVAKRVAET